MKIKFQNLFYCSVILSLIIPIGLFSDLFTNSTYAKSATQKVPEKIQGLAESKPFPKAQIVNTIGTQNGSLFENNSDTLFVEARSEGDMSVIYLIDSLTGIEKRMVDEPSSELILPMFNKFIKLSPNKTHIVYVTADNLSMKNTQLKLVEINSGSSQTLASFDNDFWTAPIIWSHNAKFIAFVKTDESSKLELWIINIESGERSLIIEHDAFKQSLFKYESLVPIGWTDDDKMVFFTDYFSENHYKTEYFVNISSKKTIKVRATSDIKNEIGTSIRASLPCGVTQFSQNHDEWQYDIMQTCGSTIGAEGCAITSTAMVFRYYGVETSPRTLNWCLGNYACPIYWDIASSNCSSGKVSYNGSYGFSWSAVESELNSSRPPIIKLDCGSYDHFVVAIEGSGSSMSGYTINDPYDGMVKSLSSYASCSLIGLRLYSGTPWCLGGDCPGPSLNSPSDGYISNSQTITFSWSAPSGCTYSGYQFRIKDTSDMNSGGTTIVDTGEGSTSRTETIGTEWNNRDLYWGVRTANPLSPNWSVRRFRIEPGGSTETRLYDSTNYGGSSAYVNETGLFTMVGVFNDMAESIIMPNGWSVRLFMHDDYSGPQVCIQGNDSNLWDNYYDNGDVAANSATWFEVYSQSSCPSMTPATPSNLRMSTSTQTSITMAWDDVSNEDGYNIYEWNGEGFVYLASVEANVTSFTDTRGSCGWTEFYEVSAYNQSGESAHTAWVQGYTKPCTPTLSIPNNGSSNPPDYDLTFQWYSSPGATEYLIEWWGGPYNTMQPCGWSSSTSCHIGIVAPDNTYSWHVKGRNSAGESPWSETWTFSILTDDSIPPSLSWVAPVNNQGVFDVAGQIISLEVDATDTGGIDRVVFMRWDYVNEETIIIGTIYTPPHQLNFATSTLLPSWNQVDACAYDNAGNCTCQYIWLNRVDPIFLKIYLPLIISGKSGD